MEEEKDEKEEKKDEEEVEEVTYANVASHRWDLAYVSKEESRVPEGRGVCSILSRR